MPDNDDDDDGPRKYVYVRIRDMDYAYGIRVRVCNIKLLLQLYGSGNDTLHAMPITDTTERHSHACSVTNRKPPVRTIYGCAPMLTHFRLEDSLGHKFGHKD